MKEFTIKSHEAGQKLDKYLMRVLDQAPKSFVYKMLRKKNIVLNDKKADGHEVLKEKDTIKIYFADDTFDKFSTLHVKALRDTDAPAAIRETANDPVRSDRSLIPEIVYEDDDILILNKPAGLLSQKAAVGDYSANDFVLEYLLTSGQLTKEDLLTFRPSICNRLDRNTSGLLIAGKSMQGLQQMSAQLKSRSMQKYYRCLVAGNVKQDAHLTGYLTKDHATNQVTITPENGVKKIMNDSDKIKKKNHKKFGKQQEKAAFIETAYHPISRYHGITLLEVHLITGRSHQIRAHLASIGHPILGDGKYGNEKLNRKLRKELNVTGQLLHAYRMEFPDGRVITAKEPEIFSKVIAAYKKDFT